MALTCPLGFDVDRLAREVTSTYTRVASDPRSTFHFHRGLDYAVDMLRYDRAELAALPATATDAIAGVGNPHRAARIGTGEIVVDLGPGGGTDLLLAARKVGPTGRAIGVELTPAMRERAQRAVAEAGLQDRVVVIAGSLMEIPLPDESVDVVISNGVLNLVPDKLRALAEAFRILRPGGRLAIADVVIQTELTEASRADVALWADCVGGALQESELVEAAADAGFVNGAVVERFRCFAGTPLEWRLHASREVMGVNFLARRPAVAVAR